MYIKLYFDYHTLSIILGSLKSEDFIGNIMETIRSRHHACALKLILFLAAKRVIRNYELPENQSRSILRKKCLPICLSHIDELMSASDLH